MHTARPFVDFDSRSNQDVFVVSNVRAIGFKCLCGFLEQEVSGHSFRRIYIYRERDSSARSTIMSTETNSIRDVLNDFMISVIQESKENKDEGTYVSCFCLCRARSYVRRERDRSICDGISLALTFDDVRSFRRAFENIRGPFR